MNNTFLSEHFSLAEATESETASRNSIVNIPTEVEIRTMEAAAVGMERVRAMLGNKPLHINSWYRCKLLNRLLNSKDTSQHMVGEAVDFIAPNFGGPIEVCQALIANKDLIRFDQLILEHTWVHISFAICSGKPKGQVLSLLSTGGYANGLTTKEGIIICPTNLTGKPQTQT